MKDKDVENMCYKWHSTGSFLFGLIIKQTEAFRFNFPDTDGLENRGEKMNLEQSTVSILTKAEVATYHFKSTIDLPPGG